MLGICYMLRSQVGLDCRSQRVNDLRLIIDEMNYALQVNHKWRPSINTNWARSKELMWCWTWSYICRYISKEKNAIRKHVQNEGMAHAQSH